MHHSEGSFQRARSKSQKDQRVSDILAAAACLLEKQGYGPVTLQHIAAEAGFTRSNLYRYFATREDVFLMIYEEEYERWANQVAHRLSEKSAMEIEAFVDIWVQTMVDCKALILLSPYLRPLMIPMVSDGRQIAFNEWEREKSNMLLEALRPVFRNWERDHWEVFMQTQAEILAGTERESLIDGKPTKVFEVRYHQTLLHYLVGVDTALGGSAFSRLNRHRMHEVIIGEND